jgi:hypothetical protein
MAVSFRLRQDTSGAARMARARTATRRTLPFGPDDSPRRVTVEELLAFPEPVQRLDPQGTETARTFESVGNV